MTLASAMILRMLYCVLLANLPMSSTKLSM